MIKKILIGIGIIILTAGIVFGVLYFLKQNNTQNSPKTDPKVTVLDHSKDYGACDLLDASSVKTELGEAAKNLQAPQNMGIVANKAIGEGVEDLVSDSQSCVYAFVAGGTIENGFNATNGLTVEKIVYTNGSGPKSLIEQVKKDGVATAVEGLGDAAFYDATPKASGPGAIYSFRLEVFIDKTSIRYIIRQPVDSVSFDAESAKAALTKLAKTAHYPN